MRPCQVGERLGYGITLILAVQVMQITVAELVPVAGELLWVELFNTVNLFFCYAALYETLIVLFLSYFTEDHLLPNFLRWRPSERFCRCHAHLEL